MPARVRVYNGAMSKFIKISMLTINVDHIVYVRETMGEYIVTMSSSSADFRKSDKEHPYEFQSIKNDQFHFSKGRPETVALEKWHKEQGL